MTVSEIDSSPTHAVQGEPASLQEAALRELVQARAVTGFLARGEAAGFVLEACLGNATGSTAVLSNSRGGRRVFASLETVATLIQRLGFDRFTVDVVQYGRGRVRAARPDRSMAMKAVKVPKKASSDKKSGKQAQDEKTFP